MPRAQIDITWPSVNEWSVGLVLIALGVFTHFGRRSRRRHRRQSASTSSSDDGDEPEHRGPDDHDLLSTNLTNTWRAVRRYLAPDDSSYVMTTLALVIIAFVVPAMAIVTGYEGLSWGVIMVTSVAIASIVSLGKWMNIDGLGGANPSTPPSAGMLTYRMTMNAFFLFICAINVVSGWRIGRFFVGNDMVGAAVGIGTLIVFIAICAQRGNDLVYRSMMAATLSD